MESTEAGGEVLSIEAAEEKRSFRELKGWRRNLDVREGRREKAVVAVREEVWESDAEMWESIFFSSEFNLIYFDLLISISLFYSTSVV